MEQLSCQFPMSVFTSQPYNYVLGDVIVFRVSAYNANGWSDPSEENTSGATAKTTPAAMNAPVRDASSSESQIVVTWTALSGDAETGGASILSYILEWDEGSGGADWEVLTGHTVKTLSTSFTISSGLVPGTAYLFRLKAENIYGEGPYSSES
jgi:hypothetical protein